MFAIFLEVYLFVSALRFGYLSNWLLQDSCCMDTNYLILTDLKAKLAKTQYDFFIKIYSWHFIDLPSVLIQNQLTHSMLHREVQSTQDDEIWVKVNGIKLWFDLSEFIIVNKLKCTGNFMLICNLSLFCSFVDLYFSSEFKLQRLIWKKNS